MTESVSQTIDEPPRPRGRSGAGGAAIVALLLVGGCLALKLAFVAIVIWHAPNGSLYLNAPGRGANVDVCVGAAPNARGVWRVGVGWQSPIMSQMPPDVLFSLYAVCVNLPAWPSYFPPRGDYMLPP